MMSFLDFHFASFILGLDLKKLACKPEIPMGRDKKKWANNIKNKMVKIFFLLLKEQERDSLARQRKFRP